MNNRIFSVMLLLVLLVSLTGNAQAITPQAQGQPSLVYVRLGSVDDLTRFATTQLPMYARLAHGLLTGAGQAGQKALQDAGLTIQVLDRNLASGTYYLVSTHSGRSLPDLAAFGQVLLRTEEGVLLRMTPSRAESLAMAGAELQAISLTAKPLPGGQEETATPSVIEPDPIIQGMIDQVTETQVYTYDRQLAGELAVPVDGSFYVIPTRYTYSGTPIQKTTSFVGQHMEDLGMNVEYHQWGGASYPNVIGEIPGSTNPDDIYIIGGHIDDVQTAPGADDNASGSVATLLAADILSQYQWGCTLRFAFWTGEEQGLLGSAAYAHRAYQQGENILGYLNLDMLAWNTLNSPPYINLFYSSGDPDTYQFALLFQDVISAYNLDLLTRLGQDLWGSDHNSFWDWGFNSILAIEDDIGGDFNPYYHSPNDTPAHTDPAYFTNFVKASIATFAHETGCLISPPQGALDGHVTIAGEGTPVVGASVTAENGVGHAYPTTSDPTGYYTLTLPADIYTVTVSADGYLPAEVGGVEVISGTTTTQDFALQLSCNPISGLGFDWVPLEPRSGETVSFAANAEGTQPVNFDWSFGDGHFAAGEAVTHAYSMLGDYSVNLTASNTCSTQEITATINVLKMMIFLPLIDQ
jgi:PKD repeat protein